MASVRVEEFTHILPLIWALFDDLAVILEQVVNEKLVEFLRRRLLVFVYLSGKCFAEEQSVGKGV